MHRHNLKVDTERDVPRRRRHVVRYFASAIVLLVVLGTIGVVVALGATLNPAYSWYTTNPEATSFTITSPAQLAGLAHIVAGDATTSDGIAIAEDDFKGKTITCEQSLNLFYLSGWKDTPFIGTVAHPFEGTFDGGAVKFSGFKPDVTDTTQNIGLFGVTGKDSTIRNVELFSTCSTAVALTSRYSEQIKNVGTVVGWAKGDVIDCTSAASVIVTSAVAATEDQPVTISCVGGVAGRCDGNMTGCSSTAAVSISASSNSASTSSSSSSRIAEYFGGVVGLQGEDGAAGTHGGDISNCSFTGSLTVDTSGYAGIFDQGGTLVSTGYGAGGIAGCAQGDISECTNDAKLTVINVASSGGIVGAYLADGSVDGNTDADNKDSETITISHCTNADTNSPDQDESGLFGYADVGGIVGTAGSSTAITQCDNTAYIRASRWNKPSGAGIAGDINGTCKLSYCYNSGDVINWTSDDTNPGTYIQGIGFYMAGICGTAATVTVDGATLLAAPEIYACYNRGHILMSSIWRVGGICGENNGSVHDCYFLDGTVQGVEQDDGSITYPTVGRDYGTTADSVGNLSSSVLCASVGVAKLNACCEADDWACYYTVDLTQSKWPMFNWQSSLTDDTRTDLATGAITASQTAYASYSSTKDPTPTLSVTFNGALLYQNADFKVVAQTGAKKVTSRSDDKKPYEASLQGLGRYKGLATNVCTYGISPADFSTCTVSYTGGAVKYDGNTKTFKKSSVTVTDAAGGVVDPGEYTLKFATSGTTYAWDILYPSLWASGTRQALKAGTADIATAAYWTPGMYINGQPTDTQYAVYDAYPIIATAVGTGNYSGSALGSAVLIKPTDLTDDWKTTDVTFEDGSIWSYDDANGNFKDSSGNSGITVTYTGQEYKPTMTVKNTDTSSSLYGKTLTSLFMDSTSKKYPTSASYGDYCYIYGADASTIDDGKNSASRNTDVSTSSYHASVAVRATAESTGLSDYRMVSFTIEPRNVSDSGVDVYVPTQKATGSALDPVEINYNGMTLVEGTDYTISYQNNVSPGTASYTVTGMGNYTGTRTGTFDIVDSSANLISVDRTFFSENSEKSLIVRSYEATDLDTPISTAAEGDVVVVKASGSASRDITLSVTDLLGNTVKVTQDASSSLPYYGTFAMPASGVKLTFSYDTHLTFYMREGNGPLQKGKTYTASDLLATFKDGEYLAQNNTYGNALPSFLWKSKSTGRWYVTTSGSYQMYIQYLATGYYAGFSDMKTILGDNGTGGYYPDWSTRTSYSVLHDGEETTVSASDGKSYFYGDVPEKYNSNSTMTAAPNGYNKCDQILSFFSVTSPVPSNTRADTVAAANTTALTGKLPYTRSDVDSDSWGVCLLTGMTADQFTSTGDITDSRFIKNINGFVINAPGDISKATVTYGFDGTIASVTDRNGVKLTEGTDYTVSYEKTSRTATITPTATAKYAGTLKVQIPATTLAGNTALDTMETIAQNAYTAGSSQAVIVTSADYHDALAAAAYARLVDGPILLTGSKKLSTQVIDDIKKQGITKVTIIGGPAAISAGVASSLESLLGASNVSRIYGDTAYATARAVYEQGKGQWSDTCIVGSGLGYADALSISPFAFTNRSPFFMTGKSGKIDADTLTTITAAGFKNIVVVGGTSVVSKDVYNTLASLSSTEKIVRLAGDNQYGTSAAIAQWMVEDANDDGYTSYTFSYTGAAFATAKNFPDALAASTLQGRLRAPLMLYDYNRGADAVENLLDDRYSKFSYIVFLGGSSAIPDSTKQFIVDILGWDEFGGGSSS